MCLKEERSFWRGWSELRWGFRLHPAARWFDVETQVRGRGCEVHRLLTLMIGTTEYQTPDATVSGRSSWNLLPSYLFTSTSSRTNKLGLASVIISHTHSCFLPCQGQCHHGLWVPWDHVWSPFDGESHSAHAQRWVSLTIQISKRAVCLPVIHCRENTVGDDGVKEFSNTLKNMVKLTHVSLNFL